MTHGHQYVSEFLKSIVEKEKTGEAEDYLASIDPRLVPLSKSIKAEECASHYFAIMRNLEMLEKYISILEKETDLLKNIEQIFKKFFTSEVKNAKKYLISKAELENIESLLSTIKTDLDGNDESVFNPVYISSLRSLRHSLSQKTQEYAGLKINALIDEEFQSLKHRSISDLELTPIEKYEKENFFLDEMMYSCSGPTFQPIDDKGRSKFINAHIDVD